MHLIKPATDKSQYEGELGTDLHNIPRAIQPEHPGEYPSDEQHHGHTVHLDVEGEGVKKQPLWSQQVEDQEGRVKDQAGAGCVPHHNVPPSSGPGC